MNYTFRNLADVELLEEVPEEATAFIELDGIIKRVSSKGLCGEGGIKTAIIKDSEYDNALAELSTMSAAGPAYTYECTNMTFEEAYEAMSNGEPLACIYLSSEGLYGAAGPAPIANNYGISVFLGNYFGVPCIGFLFVNSGLELIWTTDGLSTEYPGGR